MSQIEFYTLCPVRAGGPNYIKLDPARLHATILTSVILTSPPPLSALKLRQGWGCECTFLLASPECARPLCVSDVPLGRVVVCSAANHTAQSSRIAIRLWMQPLPLPRVVFVFCVTKRSLSVQQRKIVCGNGKPSNSTHTLLS